MSHCANCGTKIPEIDENIVYGHFCSQECIEAEELPKSAGWVGYLVDEKPAPPAVALGGGE